MSDKEIICEFLADDYLVKLTDEAYNIIAKDKDPILINLYHLANAGMKIIENHGLDEELRQLIIPVIESQATLNKIRNKKGGVSK